MGPDFSATYTFGANGTFAESAGGSETWTNLQYPGVACSHSDASAAQYCADFQQNVSNAYGEAADAGTSPFKFMGFTCTPSGNEVCKCNESITYPPYTVEGTYTTSGDTITMVITSSSLPGYGGGDAGTSSPSVYCVSGNTLTLGPTPGSSVEGAFVLTR
jgi:hypothetical protein